MSQANSRVQLPAPLCVSVSGIAMGTHDTTRTRFSTGECLLAAAVVAGATVADFDVLPGAGVASSTAVNATVGFQNNDVIIVGYGTDTQEEITLGASAVTDHNTLAVAANQKWKYKHAAGARIIRKTTAMQAIRPGSVSISRVGGSNPVATDNGLGVISGTDGGAITGTVDYATGMIIANWAAAAATGAVTAAYEALQDSPDMNDLKGQGFFANAPALLMSRDGVPSHIIVSNLGSSTVGVFVEITRNNGKSFTSKGFTGVSLNLKGLTSGVISVPAGTGPVLDGIRIRAGQKQSSASTLDADEARIIQDGKIECDFVTAPRNANAGGL